MEKRTNWQKYRNKEFRFEISYPEGFVVEAKRDGLEDFSTVPLFHLRIVDNEIAQSDMTDYEIPVVTINVFNRGELLLDEWITENAPEGIKDSCSLSGIAGFRLQMEIMIAPNTLYYTMQDSFVYELTPHGNFSDQIIQTFVVW